MDQRHLAAAMRAAGVDVSFRSLASPFAVGTDGALRVAEDGSGEWAFDNVHSILVRPAPSGGGN